MLNADRTGSSLVCVKILLFARMLIVVTTPPTFRCESSLLHWSLNCSLRSSCWSIYSAPCYLLFFVFAFCYDSQREYLWLIRTDSVFFILCTFFSLFRCPISTRTLFGWFIFLSVSFWLVKFLLPFFKLFDLNTLQSFEIHFFKIVFIEIHFIIFGCSFIF